MSPLPKRHTSRLGIAGATLLLLMFLVAAGASWLAPYDPNAQVGRPFASPSLAHPLGVNDVGQDILSELIYGARVSLGVGISAALAATALGTLVGVAAGEFRGVIDGVAMRIVDVLLTIPVVLLAIVVGVFAGPGLLTQVLVIGAVIWADPARELRAQVLSARERVHVQAVRAMGASRGRILSRYLLPAVFPLVVPHLVRAANQAILLEASLSFLGLGDPTAESWGTMLSYAHARNAFLTDAWLWWVLPPGLCIMAAVLGFALVGYALEERGTARGWAAPRPSQPAGASRPRRSSSPESQKAWPGSSPGGACPPGRPPLLAIERLSVEYRTTGGTVRALDDVSLSLHRGEALGLVGESGSGKTTVAAALMGLLPPSSDVTGRVRFAGMELTRLAPQQLQRLRGARIALIPQDAMRALDPVMRIRDQIAEAIRAHRPLGRRAARARARQLLVQLGIPPKRAADYPHQFSGGMRQRAVIAMAVANEPDLIIADEPTTGLDAMVREEVLGLLEGIKARSGTTLIVISHDIAAVMRLADRIAVLQSGRLVEEGRARRIATLPRHPYTCRLFGGLPPAPPHRAGTGGPLLEIRGLSKSFRGGGAGGVAALCDVGLEVGRAEVVGIIGASGAGKTTIARLVAGLERPDAGRITFEGVDVTGATPRARAGLARRIHLIFQDPYEALPPGMRVRDIVAEPLAIAGGRSRSQRRALALEALEEVALTPAEQFAERYPQELSGGQRQRVALARAIILRPSLIVADEPIEMLDTSVRLELLALMEHLRAEYSTAYLYITHDPAVVRATCERVVVMRAGHVVEWGRTEEVIANPKHEYTAALMRQIAPSSRLVRS